MESIVMNCDCMEYMKTVPDGWFDLAVCDPPYGINAGMGTGRSIRTAIENGKYTGGNWDFETPSKEYFEDLFRISKSQIIWGGNYFDLPASKSFIVWDKGETMYGRDFAECEFAWCTPDKPAKIFKLSPTQLDRIHPTQKPIRLYQWLYKNYLPSGGKVIDTHLGSGSNRIAADMAGNIDFYACELDKDYFEAQEKRFALYLKQPRIEFPNPVIVEQSKLF